MRQGTGSAVALFAGVLVVAGGLGWLLYVVGEPSEAPAVAQPDVPKDPRLMSTPVSGDAQIPRIEAPARKPAPGARARFPYEGHEDIDLRDWKAAAEAFLDFAAAQRDMAIRGKPAFEDEKARANVLRRGTRYNTAVMGAPSGWFGPGTMVRVEHPAFSANLVAASLDIAKLPLTEAQARRIGDLARERGALLDAWDAESETIKGVFRLERVLGRTAIIGNFISELYSVLTPAQAEAICPEEFRDRLSLDHVSPAVVWFPMAQQMSYVDDKGLAESITASLTTQYSLQERQDELRVIVEEWVRANPNEASDVLDRRGPMKVARVEKAARRMVELFRTILERMDLPAETAENVRQVAGVWVPMKR